MEIDIYSGVKKDDVGVLLAYLGSRGFALSADGRPLKERALLLQSSSSSAEVDAVLKGLFPSDANVVWTDLLQV